MQRLLAASLPSWATPCEVGNRSLVRKGGTLVRITVIKLPRPLGRVLMAIMAMFGSKKSEGGESA